ncbi:MAG: ATP-binding cassette domain-containing protein [Propionicimonas sp.]|uniref:ATP-binding cassette domain-containing protein n=1 Tax=Propionicimonas sp. TaxID=1955623 RepID=UPI003D121A5A
MERFNSQWRQPVDSTTAAPVLELRDVSKSFGAVVALRRADLSLRAGSIHAVVGENGAGKSTLVKIMAGLYQRDTGTFEMDGDPVHFRTTADGQGRRHRRDLPGADAVPRPVGDGERVHGPPAGGPVRPDRQGARCARRSSKLMNRLGVRIDPDRLTDGLSIADQQIIEIAKAISLDARVLIMDEPTAALSGVEVERLFTVARSLRDEGRALMFISHRFDEVFGLCDTVTVMRDGTYISTSAIADTTEAEIVRLMVGREVTELFPKIPAEIGKPLLEVKGLGMPGAFA